MRARTNVHWFRGWFGHSRSASAVPIPAFVEVLAITRVRTRPLPRPLWRRIDPWLLCVLAVIAAIAIWTMAPTAGGAGAPTPSDTRIEVAVPVATSVTPGWTSGTDVRLGDVALAGEPIDATSSGWSMA